MLAALYALIASVCWGSSDFIGGVNSRRHGVWSVVAVSQPAAFLGAGAVLLIVWPTPLPWHEAVWPFLGGISGALAMFGYYRAMEIGTISIVAPIVAAGSLVPVVWGLAAGDKPGIAQIVGIVVTVTGIVLISRSEVETHDKSSVQSIVLAIAAAIGFGLMLIGFARGGHSEPYWSVFDARVGSLVTVAIYLLAARPKLNVPRRAVVPMASVGIGLFAANTFFTLATTQGYLSVVSVLGNLSPAITIALARGILKEKLTTAQWVGAMVTIAGVILLALG